MKRFSFYSKVDSKKETIQQVVAPGRLEAAKLFAKQKKLTLKQFLQIYSIKK